MSQNDLYGSAFENEVKETKKSPLGIMATAVLGGSLVALYAVAAPFVAPALRKVCLPFVPATTAQVENVLRVLQSRSGTLVDIGSGDGRIVSTCSWSRQVLYKPGTFPSTAILCSAFLIFQSAPNPTVCYNGDHSSERLPPI